MGVWDVHEQCCMFRARTDMVIDVKLVLGAPDASSNHRLAV